jgi:hypothetical protein
MKRPTSLTSPGARGSVDMVAHEETNNKRIPELRMNMNEDLILQSLLELVLQILTG